MLTVKDFATKHCCMSAIERAISYAPSKLERALIIPVTWNTRLHNRAGRASLRLGIELHPGLLVEGHDALRSTFLHELAHIFEFLMHNTAGHGVNWIIQMARLGLDPMQHRTHAFVACMQRAQPTTLASLVTPSDFD